MTNNAYKNAWARVKASSFVLLSSSQSRTFVSGGGKPSGGQQLSYSKVGSKITIRVFTEISEVQPSAFWKVHQLCGTFSFLKIGRSKYIWQICCPSQRNALCGCIADHPHRLLIMVSHCNYGVMGGYIWLGLRSDTNRKTDLSHSARMTQEVASLQQIPEPSSTLYWKFQQ